MKINELLSDYYDLKTGDNKKSKGEFLKKWARECSYNHDCHDCKYAPECGQVYLQIQMMIQKQ